jgi:hypothetical protein
MRAWLKPIALAAALLALPADAARAMEAVPLLDAFKTACAGIRDYDAARADALKSGWTEITGDADPRIARLVALGQKEVGDDATMTGAYFRHSIGDRTVFLILTHVVMTDSKIWAKGCRVYDFDAPREYDVATLAKWIGKAPTHSENHGGAVKRLWEPGWADGVSVEVTFMPAGHPVAGSTGVQGNVLTASAIGGF